MARGEGGVGLEIGDFDHAPRGPPYVQPPPRPVRWWGVKSAAGRQVGRLMRNDVGQSGIWTISMPPPWASTARLQKYRPRPALPNELASRAPRRNFSKTRWRSRSGMGGPSLDTLISTAWLDRLVVTAIRPFAGVYRK